MIMITSEMSLKEVSTHLEAREALTEAMERSVLDLKRFLVCLLFLIVCFLFCLELEMFSREAAVVVRNSRKAESRSLRGRDWGNETSLAFESWLIC